MGIEPEQRAQGQPIDIEVDAIFSEVFDHAIERVRDLGVVPLVLKFARDDPRGSSRPSRWEMFPMWQSALD